MPDGPRSEELVFEGAIFSVHRERWPGADHPFEVVRHVGAAAVLPLTPDGDVILVRQLRPAIREALLEVPAGLLDHPDEDAAGCAARELLEETGYAHASMAHLARVFTTAGFSDEVVGKLKRAYRYLLQSKLNTTQALLHIEQDSALACPEVVHLVEFIRTATRGAILRRGGRKTDDGDE